MGLASSSVGVKVARWQEEQAAVMVKSSQCSRGHLFTYKQSCIKFKKFNSSSVHGIELRGQFKFSSLDKN